MSNCGCGSEEANSLEKKTLIIVLVINGAMFFAELLLGWIAQSTGLIADSLDMLADALVYGIALFAVGKSDCHRSTAASLSGKFQILLGAAAFCEVIRRLLFGSEPQSLMIMSVGLVAVSYTHLTLPTNREV